jgi:hypothetical protein
MLVLVADEEGGVAVVSAELAQPPGFQSVLTATHPRFANQSVWSSATSPQER